MRHLALSLAVTVLVCGAPVSAVAGPADPAPVPLTGCPADAPRATPWAVDFSVSAPAVAAPAPVRFSVGDQEPPARRPLPVEYSDGYRTRAKIHKVTSIATLPLFVANYFVGQDLYNNPGDESMKSVHVGLVAGTAAVFGVNTFTGAWNLWEGRKDPNHRAKRMTHGILMIAADIGFLATAALAPESEGDEYQSHDDFTNRKQTHRTVALTSMGIATVSYLIMLFGRD